MTVDRLLNWLVTITLIEMMVTVGLRVTFAQLGPVARDGWLIARAALANYVVVPAVTVVLLLLVGASPLVAIGFLVLAVCPGAPYGPPFTAIAQGNVPAAVGLMVVLAGSSAILSPLLLQVLMPWLSAGETVRIEPVAMVVTLLVTQLLPLLAGLLLAHWRPGLAARLVAPFELVSKVLNLAVAGLILVTQFQMLLQIRLIGLLAMLILLAASLAIGWLAGGSDGEMRKAMAVTTGLRNAGVGLVIATGAFAGTPAASAVVAYAIVAVFGTLLVATWWGRQASAQQRVGA